MPLSQENRMQIAISAIRNQKIQSKRKAAGIFEVSETTLCKQFKENHTQKHTPMAIN